MLNQRYQSSIKWSDHTASLKPNKYSFCNYLLKNSCFHQIFYHDVSIFVRSLS